MANQVSRSRKANKKQPVAVPPVVSVIMGSKSDWDTMKAASDVFTEFGIPHECRVISAHRTPELLLEFTATAEERGIEVIIAGAGGAAHLAGVTAAHTILPVLGVPIESKALKGMDSLLSTVQMPGGIPVGTLAIGSAGAKNAALLAIAIMGTKKVRFREKLKQYREKMKRKLAEETLP
jgi:5-(carboxyamino)imidazole ribonucleotide mutase